MVVSTLKDVITPDNIEKGIALVSGAGGLKFLSNSKTFNNLWDITIGNKLEAWNQKSVFKNQQHVEKYKSDCFKKISEIPEDKIQDPKLSIVGPALEASKFYIEEEEIRDMFSNLIASSMNSDYGDIPHSFVEIIKQLSPFDAKLFQSFTENSNTIVDFVLENEKGNSFKYYEDIHISPNFSVADKNAISIINLQKQGLIKILYGTYLTNDSFYEIYQPLKNKIELNASSFPLLDGFPAKLIMSKHMFGLTALGKKFKNICCK